MIKYPGLIRINAWHWISKEVELTVDFCSERTHFRKEIGHESFNHKNWRFD